MQETEQTPEVVEYDMSHYAILKDAAIKKGWSIHKLADRLDEEEHVHVSAATRDDGFQILSLKGYTNLVHHKILDELTALPVAPNTDPSLQTRLNAIIAAAELRGISAAEVEEQWRKCSPNMDMLERIVSKINSKFGEPATAIAVDIEQLRADAAFVTGSGPTPEHLKGDVEQTHQDKINTAQAVLAVVETIIEKKQSEATTLSPASVATAENGGENAGQATLGTEETKSKGRKKAEPKPPKEPKVKAEKPVDDNPEGDVVIGRDEDPKNKIAHAFKTRDLNLDLHSEGQTVLSDFYEVGIREVRLEASPDGVAWMYSGGDNELSADTRDRIESVLKNIATIYADRNKKCFIHVLDYMKLLRRRDFEKKEIEDNAKAVAKEMADKKERLEKCYDGSFSAWVKAYLNQPWNIDKDGEYKSKNIKTLAGTIQVLQSGGMTSNRAEIDKYLFELRRLAATPTGDDAELLTVQEFDAIQAARDTLDSLPVSFKEVTETVAEYDVESMKALHKAGFKIPGITETEIQPLGKIDIKPAKAEAPAK